MTAQSFSAPADQRSAQSQSSIVFRPAPDPSRWEGVAVASGVLLLDAVLLVWLLGRPVDGVSFVLLCGLLLGLLLLLHLLYRIWAAFTLAYWLDRNALHIDWAANRLCIPLPTIQQMVCDGEVPLGRSLRSWPAPFVRRLADTNGKSWELFASRPPEQSIWVQTADALFAISPAEPAEFLAALQTYHRLGPSHRLTISREHPRLCSVSVLADGLSRGLLLAGLAGVLILVATLFFNYAALPDLLIFHYSTAGLPDSIRPKNSLFLLPAIGLIVYLVNGLAGLWMVCRRQRMGAHLLWGSTLSVQILSLLALFSLIR